MRIKPWLLGTIALFASLLGTASAKAEDLASLEICQQGQPECLDAVIAKMQQHYELLAQLCEHDALFALTYLRTTETFQKTLSAIAYENPSSVIREDALFADYYFQAYDAFYSKTGGDVPPAWQTAFDAAQNRLVAGSGNLFLGFNAHIQRDLPFVLYDLYIQGHPVSYVDHTRVNQFLHQVDVTDELVQKFDPTIDDTDLPGEEDDLQRFLLIAQWRELAFRNFERLRDAESETARSQVAQEIEAYSAASANALFAAFQYPAGVDSSARDAYCRECRGSVSVPESTPTPVLLGLGLLGVVAKLFSRQASTAGNQSAEPSQF
jgi:hypothetical protein